MNEQNLTNFNDGAMRSIIKNLTTLFLCPKRRMLWLVALGIAFSINAQAATYTVTTTANAGAGSLRDAISQANASTADDTINFSIPGCASSVCTITLTTGELSANSPAAGKLTIANSTGASNLLISGNNTSRVFYFNGVDITISGLTITNGNGIGADTNFNGYGGGLVAEQSKLTLLNSIITNNTSTESGGGVYNRNCSNCQTVITNSVISSNTSTIGGGVLHAGTLIITNSTFNNNLAQDYSRNAGEGGGVINGGGANSKLNITNSTFSNNSAYRAGGGISNGGKATITNVTISNNHGNGGGGIALGSDAVTTINNSTITGNSSGNGGGIIASNGGGISLRNSIVALNTASYMGADILNSTYTTFNSKGNNLIGNTNTDVAITWQSSDILNQSPQLAPLANNGGATLTHALLSNSLAINAGNSCVTTVNGCGANDPTIAAATDQRGASRIGNLDIGAFELNTTNYVAPLPSSSPNQSYYAVIAPDNNGFSYAVTSGSLPPGLALTGGSAFASASRGSVAFAPETVVAISGTPTAGGTYNFTITATGNGGSSVTNYSLQVVAPTAAAVSIGGRVLTANGRGIANVRISLTDPNGETRMMLTNAFGFYRFEDVPAGATYILSATAKRYQFAQPTQIVSLGEDLRGIDFTALP